MSDHHSPVSPNTASPNMRPDGPRSVGPNTRLNLTLAGVCGIFLATGGLWVKTLSWARTDAEFRSELRWRLTIVESRLQTLENDKCRCKPWQILSPEAER